MKIEKLNYPIFAFGKTGQQDMIEENMIYVIPSSKENNTITLHGLKSKYFINQEIVDSKGHVYWIKDVSFVAFDGIGKYLPFLSDRRKIKVVYEYQDKEEMITLEDFKKRIIPMVEKLKDIWEEAYGDIEDLKTYINNAESFEKIAELLD